MKTRNKLLLILGVIVVAIFGFGLKTCHDAGQFKQLKPHFAGKCTRVPGVLSAEDITIHPKTGMAFIASDERRPQLRHKDGMRGDILAYSLTDAKPTLRNLTKDFKGDFRPHGISLWIGPQGSTSLFVVSHPKGKHTIEIFDLKQDKLHHRKTVQHPMMHHPNDVVAVGPNAFYATNDHGNSSGFGRAMEDFLRLAKGFVLYYDGKSMRRVAQGFAYTNGINVSPDRTKVYVSTSVGKRVYVYQRNIQSGALKLLQTIQLDTGLDNIEIDASGALWIGAHPKLLSFMGHAAKTSRLSPSEVLKLTLNKQGTSYKVKQIYLNGGRELSGSSVGAPFKKYLLIGGVFLPYFLQCTIP